MKGSIDLMALVPCMVSNDVVLHKMRLALVLKLMLKLQKEEADIITMTEERKALCLLTFGMVVADLKTLQPLCCYTVIIILF